MMDLFTWVWQVTAQTLICSALGVWISLRMDRSPARAHTAVLLALAATLLTPVASLLVHLLGAGTFVGPPPATVYRVAPLDAGPALRPDPRILAALALFLTWLGPTLGLLLALRISFVRGKKLVERSEPVHEASLLAALQAARARLGIRTEVQLHTSTEVPSPMIWAWGNSPVVLLPDESCLRLQDLDWEAVFIHELAHLARRDHLSELLAHFVTACLFWNPFVWWARRRLGRASEFACDDRVASVGKSPLDFASSLLLLRPQALVPRIPALTLTGPRSTLKTRILRLLDPRRDLRNPGLAWTVLAIVLTSLVVLGLAFAQVRPGPRPEDQSTRPSALRSADRT